MWFCIVLDLMQGPLLQFVTENSNCVCRFNVDLDLAKCVLMVLVKQLEEVFVLLVCFD